MLGFSSMSIFQKSRCQGIYLLCTGILTEAIFEAGETAHKTEKDPDLIPSTHEVTPTPGDLVPSSGFCRHLQACGTHIVMQVHNTHK